MFTTLLPDPLHPAVVHLPIALAVLLPLFAVGTAVAVHRGARSRVAWSITVTLAGALLGSGLVAKETGEDQEDRVEQVVPETALHAHEEAADRFLVAAAAVFLVSLLGLRRDRVGRGARLVTVAGSVGVLVAGWAVGQAGGELVYRHGAGAAYAAPTDPGGAGSRPDRD